MAVRTTTVSPEERAYLLEQIQEATPFCQEGELIEVHGFESRFVMGCDQTSPERLSYWFRTQMPPLQSQRASLGHELRSFEGKSRLPMDEVLSPLTRSLEDVTDPTLPYLDSLRLFLRAGLFRALDYGGPGYHAVKDIHYARVFLLHVSHTAMAAASGLELLTLDDIDHSLEGLPSLSPESTPEQFDTFLQDRARELDGDPLSFTDLEKASWEVVRTALFLKHPPFLTPEGAPARGSYDLFGPPPNDLDAPAALTLLGIYLYLQNREVERQTVFIDLDTLQFDIRGLLPQKGGSEAFRRKADALIKEEIARQLEAAFGDFEGLRIVYDTPPPQEVYSTIHFAQTIEEVRGYYAGNPPKREALIEGCQENRNALRKNFPAFIPEYFTHAYGPDFCQMEEAKLRGLMDSPLMSYALTLGSHGRAPNIDLANTSPRDDGIVYTLVRLLPQTIPVPPEMAVSRPDMKDMRIQLQGRAEAFQLKGEEDWDQVRKIGRLLGETAAHETGHLLGLGHTPEIFKDYEEDRGLMWGHGRSIEDLGHNRLNDKDRAILSLYFDSF